MPMAMRESQHSPPLSRACARSRRERHACARATAVDAGAIKRTDLTYSGQLVWHRAMLTPVPSVVCVHVPPRQLNSGSHMSLQVPWSTPVFDTTHV